MGVSLRPDPVTVRVPASSANLGPGFDCLGLALGLHDEVSVRVTQGGLEVHVEGEGAGALRTDQRHLVVRALRAGLDRLGARPAGLAVRCTNRIPHSRGLGSSAAAIVAGVCAARALAAPDVDDAAVLVMAAEIEGHPDNVAACLLGGATAAWTEQGRARAVRLPVDDRIRPVIFLPDGAKQSTRQARALLPDTVSHADAASNAARAALLVRALGGRPDLLLTATEDRLHQPYRLRTQARGGALLTRLREAGIAATLSGSGPSVLALAAGPEQAALAATLAGAGFVAQELPVDQEGATVLATGVPGQGTE